MNLYLKLIFNDLHTHPINNTVIAAFIYDLKFDMAYYYNFSHPDVLINSSFFEFKNKFKNKFIVKNKKIYKYFIDNELYDIDILSFIYTKNINKSKSYIKIKNNGIVKAYIQHQTEFLEEVKEVKRLYQYYKEIDYSYSYFDNLSEVLFLVEKNGLAIDINKFNKNFNKNEKNNIIYTDYNIYNITGRPSNSFDGINYIALSKNNFCRESFISRYKNGKLLLMDYIGYQPSIVAHLIKYKIPENETIYEHLAKLYYNKAVITEDDIKNIKKLILINLYGETSDDFLKLEFFQRVEELKNKLWYLYNKNKVLETFLYKRKLYYNIIGNISKSKLFSYIIQSAETEYNLDRIKYCLNYGNPIHILPILYVYDSLLFDIDSNVTIDQILDLKYLLEMGTFKVRTYVGCNYNTMQELHLI